MPNYTYEYIVSSLIVGMFAGMFFKGWRCPAVVLFVIGWQMLTPTRPVYEDVPMMATCGFCTELLFNIWQKGIRI